MTLTPIAPEISENQFFRSFSNEDEEFAIYTIGVTALAR